MEEEASKPRACRPWSGFIGSIMKIPGPPEGLEWNGAAAGESRKVLVKVRVRAGLPLVAFPAGKTNASMIGVLRGLIFLMRSGGRW